MIVSWANDNLTDQLLSDDLYICVNIFDGNRTDGQIKVYDIVIYMYRLYTVCSISKQITANKEEVFLWLPLQFISMLSLIIQ